MWWRFFWWWRYVWWASVMLVCSPARKPARDWYLQPFVVPPKNDNQNHQQTIHFQTQSKFIVHKKLASIVKMNNFGWWILPDGQLCKIDKCAQTRHPPWVWVCSSAGPLPWRFWIHSLSHFLPSFPSFRSLVRRNRDLWMGSAVQRRDSSRWTGSCWIYLQFCRFERRRCWEHRCWRARPRSRCWWTDWTGFGTDCSLAWRASWSARSCPSCPKKSALPWRNRRATCSVRCRSRTASTCRHPVTINQSKSTILTIKLATHKSTICNKTDFFFSSQKYKFNIKSIWAWDNENESKKWMLQKLRNCTTETIVAESECWFLSTVTKGVESVIVIDTKFEFLAGSGVFALRILHLSGSGVRGELGGGSAPRLLGTRCCTGEWLILSIVMLVFSRSLSFALGLAATFSLCWSFSFSKSPTKGVFELEESDELFELHLLGCLFKEPSSSETQTMLLSQTIFFFFYFSNPFSHS